MNYKISLSHQYSKKNKTTVKWVGFLSDTMYKPVIKAPVGGGKATKGNDEPQFHDKSQRKNSASCISG